MCAHAARSDGWHQGMCRAAPDRGACPWTPRSRATLSPTYCRLQVVVYDTLSGRALRAFSRFRDKAYSAVFRGDGRLLAAGGEEGVVQARRAGHAGWAVHAKQHCYAERQPTLLQVFDASSRALLRQLSGHARPAHVVRFPAAPSHARVFSGGDDGSARLWDIELGQQVCFYARAQPPRFLRCLRAGA